MITPERLDAWRIVPRLLILAYMVVFYQTCNWFMDLPDPNNAQAGFVSVVVGAGAAWFGLYVNSTSTKHEGPVAVPQATGSMPSASASVSTPRAEPVATEDDSLPPPVRRM